MKTAIIYAFLIIIKDRIYFFCIRTFPAWDCGANAGPFKVKKIDDGNKKVFAGLNAEFSLGLFSERPAHKKYIRIVIIDVGVLTVF
jgi:hypothetical protein